MLTNPKKDDTTESLVVKRIKYFKELRERHKDINIRNICLIKISTLEMVLRDLSTLKNLHKQA